jgi:hypothetical protein
MLHQKPLSRAHRAQHDFQEIVFLQLVKTGKGPCPRIIHCSISKGPNTRIDDKNTPKLWRLSVVRRDKSYFDLSSSNESSLIVEAIEYLRSNECDCVMVFSMT